MWQQIMYFFPEVKKLLKNCIRKHQSLNHLYHSSVFLKQIIISQLQTLKMGHFEPKGSNNSTY